MKVWAMAITLPILFSAASAALAADEGAKDETLHSLPGDKSAVFNLVLPPHYQPPKKYPVIVSLHGAGMDGAAMVLYWKEAAMASGCILCCPKSQGKTWGESDLRIVYRISKYVLKNYAADPQRVLLSGYSDGGRYVYVIGLRLPELFPYLNPMSGGFGEQFMNISKPLKPVPVFITHGAKDPIIPVWQGRKAASTLRKYRFDVTYLEEPDYGHGMFDFKEAREKILTWFLERSAGK